MVSRNTSDKTRKVSVNLTVSVDEREKLQWAADELGLTLASYVRMAALRDAKGVIG